MAQQITPRPQSGIQTAIENLTDGFSRLVRQHLELAKIEARQEARELGRHAATLAIFASIALIGYGILNLAFILIALWFGGVPAMAITSLVLAILNLGAAGFALYRTAKELSDNEILPKTSEEMQRNKKWIKEIRENSSPRLTAENS